MMQRATKHSVQALSKRLLGTYAPGWAGVEQAPLDPILGLTVRFKQDQNPNKVNVGVGAFRDNNGQPYVLPSVESAAKRLLDRKLDQEYAPIDGDQKFVKQALEFMFGDEYHDQLEDGTIAGVQTLSGTGACRIFGEFVAKFIGKDTPIFLPNPTWGNHIPIFNDAGLKTPKYRYYHPETVGLDFEGMCADMRAAPKGSVFLLHACAHNPTGIDPTLEQWSEIAHVMKECGHLPFFDCAYQGFASGDKDKDSAAMRCFLEGGFDDVFIAQSFAKNFGLYGQRIGTLSVASKSGAAPRIQSQLKRIIRPMYSSPPIQGARLVSEVLSDAGLKAQWKEDCAGMASRISSMRDALTDQLQAVGSTRDWSHIKSQIGMFCYTGLAPEQVKRLIEEYSIYLTNDGRVSMAGVTTHNVEYLAKAIHDVSK